MKAKMIQVEQDVEHVTVQEVLTHYIIYIVTSYIKWTNIVSNYVKWTNIQYSYDKNRSRRLGHSVYFRRPNLDIRGGDSADMLDLESQIM